MKTLVLNGIYRHFKGRDYKVLHVAKHSETQENLVVYQAMYEEHVIWVRPIDMFLEKVVRDGQTFERFSYVPPQTETCLSVELDEETKSFLFENNIDLIYELKREYPQIICKNEFDNDGSKDIGMIILCGGIAASLVIISIEKLLETILYRPRVIVVEEMDDNGNTCNRHTELLQPNLPKSSLAIGTEIDSTKVKITIEDRKE